MFAAQLVPSTRTADTQKQYIRDATTLAREDDFISLRFYRTHIDTLSFTSDLAPSTPARSPNRLRTKTVDLADLLHGRSSKGNGSTTDTDAASVPHAAISPAMVETTPSKPKRKPLANLLARRRKSGIFGPDAQKDEEWTTVDEYCPAVPDALRKR